MRLLRLVIMAVTALAASACGYFIPQSKPLVVPRRMPETLPPTVFDGDAFITKITSDGRHPAVVASEYEGKVYLIRFRVDYWYSNGEAVGLCGSTGRMLAIKMPKGVRLGDWVETRAKFLYYLPEHREKVVFWFRLVE